jgi:hypothetical protein
MINRLGHYASMLGNISLGLIPQFLTQYIISNLNLSQIITPTTVVHQQFILRARRGDAFTFPLPIKTTFLQLGFRGRFKTAESVTYYFTLTNNQLTPFKIYLNYYRFDYFVLNHQDILYLRLTENNEKALDLFNRDNQVILDFDLIKES